MPYYETIYQFKMGEHIVKQQTISLLLI